MDFLRNNILTILIFLPLAGPILTPLARTRAAGRWTARATTLVTFAMSLVLFGFFDWGKGGSYAWLSGGGDPAGIVQLRQEANWIPAFNIHYKVGIDGLSFPLVI